ncbi:DUF4254 domain-containing protein [Clostridiaceae bacterium]|jgi:hypothetical protein|nr:DUF4254 domain-containing protein [Clostridiaceae bacterium]
MKRWTAAGITEIIQEQIISWHNENQLQNPDRVIVTDEIRKIRPLNDHRDDVAAVIRELVVTNTEMWHEEDKVRSMQDDVVLKAIRNINPLNQHRNDLIEEIDEIMIDAAQKRGWPEGEGDHGNRRKPD